MYNLTIKRATINAILYPRVLNARMILIVQLGKHALVKSVAFFIHPQAALVVKHKNALLVTDVSAIVVNFGNEDKCVLDMRTVAFHSSVVRSRRSFVRTSRLTWQLKSRG